MNAWSTIQLPMLAAGLGLFLFGVSMLEEAIKSLAGRSFKLFLQKQTGLPVKAVFAGALTTAIMTSSTTVTLLVMSFTGSGILPLQNGIGLILGANLGTTFTGWMVALLGFSLQPEKLFLLLTAAGALGYSFLPSGKAQTTSKLILGFGLLFLGLNYMKEAFGEFASSADVSWLTGKPLVLFILFGFVLAAALRSSTAAMVIFLTSLSAGSITLLQGAYLAIGADLGTTITGLIGTLNGNAARKKTGWAQFYINLITGVITVFTAGWMLQLISLIGVKDPLVSLVSFHSMFNLVGILLILPFIKPFTKWIDNLTPAGNGSLTSFLSSGNTRDIIASIDALERETKVFLQRAILVRKQLYMEPADALPASEYYTLKEYENEIFTYTLPILQKSLSQSEASEIQTIFSSIRSATLSVKEIKDIRHNIADFRQHTADLVFQLEEQINQSIQSFSKRISELSSEQFRPERFEDLHQENEASYSNFKEIAFHAYQQHPETDLASLLNLIREVRDSNALILKAMHLFIQVTSNSPIQEQDHE